MTAEALFKSWNTPTLLCVAKVVPRRCKILFADFVTGAFSKEGARI